MNIYEHQFPFLFLNILVITNISHLYIYMWKTFEYNGNVVVQSHFIEKMFISTKVYFNQLSTPINYAIAF